jgi:hypothetical protein
MQRTHKPAEQYYPTSSPVAARPMIIRWIPGVPSKIVKISGLAVCDNGQ